MLDLYSVDLLEEAVSEQVRDVDFCKISVGDSGALVYRIKGMMESGRSFSVVSKSRKTESINSALWYCQDSAMIDREYHVYELLERLNLPHAEVLAKQYNAPHDWTLILEDLTENYVLLTPDEQFTEAHREMTIKTYAAIHAATLGLSDNSEPIINKLAPEEGSIVDASILEDMIEVFFDSNFKEQFDQHDFREAAAVLFSVRAIWQYAPRCLTFNDFYQTNVAFPKSGTGYAVLFDWELAGLGLPQFDALNAGFTNELSSYFECLCSNGVEVDIDKYNSGLGYAELCAVFSALRLLYLKLKSDPNGRIPLWMQSIARNSFSGGLIAKAREVLL